MRFGKAISISLLFLVLGGCCLPLVAATNLCAGLDYSYQNQDISFLDEYWISESFIGNDEYLNFTTFYGYNADCVAELICGIFDTTGTYGSSMKPTGSALAWSDLVNCTDISDSWSLINFTFSGDNRILLDDDYYCVVLCYSNGSDVVSSPELFHVGRTNNYVVYAGNWAVSTNDGLTYTVSQYYDWIFYVWTEESLEAPTPTPEMASQEDIDAAWALFSLAFLMAFLFGGLFVLRRKKREYR